MPNWPQSASEITGIIIIHSSIVDQVLLETPVESGPGDDTAPE